MKTRQILEINFPECGIVFWDEERLSEVIEFFLESDNSNNAFMEIIDCRNKELCISQWGNKAFRVHTHSLVEIDNFNKKEFLETLQKELNKLN